MSKENKIKSMYIHIPFCDTICSYCDFCKMFYNEKLVDRYLDALKEEILENYRGEVLDTLYIGGGTPSSLSASQLKKLFCVLSSIKLNKECEFTMEVTIDSLTHEKIDILKENGVNRVSIGVQTINEKFFKFLNRKTDKDKLIEDINYLKSVQIDNINLDLMYALKDETIEDVLNDLDFFISLDVKHISTYSLILEENTMLYINKYSLIDSNIDRKMYDVICKKLKQNGYIHYEVSNFSKEGYLSKHNMTYWNNDRYYGFGLGSSGYINNIRYTNTRSINSYIHKKFRYLEEVIDSKSDMENEIMLNLRTARGLSKEKFCEKFNKDILALFDIKFLIDDNILIDDGKFLRVSDQYFYVLNNILVKIFANANC